MNPGKNLKTTDAAVTLDMVAREARVSASTVSRILNGTARVRESKAQAVQAAIAKLKFLPNPVAQSLARGRSRERVLDDVVTSREFASENLRNGVVSLE